MKRVAVSIVVAALVASASVAAGAANTNAQESGLQVAAEADRRNAGWIGMTASLNMSLRNAYGQDSRRSLRLMTMEVGGEGDRSIVVFDEPADVRSTALLTHARVTKPDDQWMYFPAAKRTKRVASVNKSGPFMGSEFAFEDMAPWELGKYTYRLIGEEIEDGSPVYVLEMVPTFANSGYSRQVALMDKAEFFPRKIDYYDRKGALLKTQTFADYKVYLNRYWRAGRMEMVNHVTGKSTALSWSEYAFRNDLAADDFEPGALDRRR